MPIKKQNVLSKNHGSKGSKSQQKGKISSRNNEEDFDQILEEAAFNSSAAIVGSSVRTTARKSPGWYCTNHRGVQETFVNFEILRWKIINEEEKADEETLGYLSELEKACHLTKSKRKALSVGPLTEATRSVPVVSNEDANSLTVEPDFFLQARSMTVGTLSLMLRMFALSVMSDKDGYNVTRCKLYDLLTLSVTSFSSTVTIEGEQLLAMNGARHYYPVACMLRFWLSKNRGVEEYGQWMTAVKQAKLANSTYGVDDSPSNAMDMVHACEHVGDILVEHVEHLSTPENWELYCKEMTEIKMRTITIPDQNGLDLVKEGDLFRHLGKDLLRLYMSTPEEALAIVAIVREYREGDSANEAKEEVRNEVFEKE